MVMRGSGNARLPFFFPKCLCRKDLRKNGPENCRKCLCSNNLEHVPAKLDFSSNPPSGEYGKSHARKVFYFLFRNPLTSADDSL